MNSTWLLRTWIHENRNFVGFAGKCFIFTFVIHFTGFFLKLIFCLLIWNSLTSPPDAEKLSYVDTTHSMPSEKTMELDFEDVLPKRNLKISPDRIGPLYDYKKRKTTSATLNQYYSDRVSSVLVDNHEIDSRNPKKTAEQIHLFEYGGNDSDDDDNDFLFVENSYSYTVENDKSRTHNEDFTLTFRDSFDNQVENNLTDNEKVFTWSAWETLLFTYFSFPDVLITSYQKKESSPVHTLFSNQQKESKFDNNNSSTIIIHRIVLLGLYTSPEDQIVSILVLIVLKSLCAFIYYMYTKVILDM